MIDDYFQYIDELLTSTGSVYASNMTYDKRSTYVGFIRGEVYFLDASRLFFREFVNVQHGIDRYMYVYHYQTADGRPLFRYDNTPHYPDLSTFPHHKHDNSETNVVAAEPADLEVVLRESIICLRSDRAFRKTEARSR